MCSICDVRIEFGVGHPQALMVAVATRRAMDAGLLPDKVHDWDRALAISLMLNVRNRFERVLAPEDMLELPRFFLLLAETGTWAYFSTEGERVFAPSMQRAPPDDFSGDAGSMGREAVFLATETAMAAMLDGRLPFNRAMSEGVLLIDAAPEEEVALRAAWASSWPVVGFSRFVCS